MFATWKYDPKDNNAVFSTQTHTFDPATAKTISHAACASCRAQKLKCDGDRSGCQRCKGQGRECTYADVTRQKKGTQASAKTRGPASSTASLTNSLIPSEHQEDPNPLQHQDQGQGQGQGRGQSKLQAQAQAQIQAQTEAESETETQAEAGAGVQAQEQLPPQHGDLTWLMAQPPDSNLFADFDMQHDMTNATDVSDTLFDMTSSIMDSSSSQINQTSLTNPSPIDVGSDGSDYPFKPQGSAASPCQCLYHVAMGMDQLDVAEDCAQAESLNNLLIFHKEVLANSAKMLGCSICTGRVENMLILTILLDKLARRLQGVVRLRECSASGLPTLSLGDYMVDSLEEYVALNCTLLRVQLRRLQTLAQALKHVSLRFHSETLARRLTACMGKVTTSLDELRSLSG